MPSYEGLDLADVLCNLHRRAARVVGHPAVVEHRVRAFLDLHPDGQYLTVREIVGVAIYAIVDRRRLVVDAPLAVLVLAAMRTGCPRCGGAMLVRHQSRSPEGLVSHTCFGCWCRTAERAGVDARALRVRGEVCDAAGCPATPLGLGAERWCLACRRSWSVEPRRELADPRLRGASPRECAGCAVALTPLTSLQRSGVCSAGETFVEIVCGECCAAAAPGERVARRVVAPAADPLDATIDGETLRLLLVVDGYARHEHRSSQVLRAAWTPGQRLAVAAHRGAELRARVAAAAARDARRVLVEVQW